LYYLKPVIPDERRAAKRDPESRIWYRIEDFWIPARAPIQALRLKRTFSRRAGLAGMAKCYAVSMMMVQAVLSGLVVTFFSTPASPKMLSLQS
jgi:hypothetical protein